MKILANLTASTKNYGLITLNTKPYSDPLERGTNIFFKLLYYFFLYLKHNKDCVVVVVASVGNENVKTVKKLQFIHTQSFYD